MKKDFVKGSWYKLPDTEQARHSKAFLYFKYNFSVKEFNLIRHYYTETIRYNKHNLTEDYMCNDEWEIFAKENPLTEDDIRYLKRNFNIIVNEYQINYRNNSLYKIY